MGSAWVCRISQNGDFIGKNKLPKPLELQHWEGFQSFSTVFPLPRTKIRSSPNFDPRVHLSHEMVPHSCRSRFVGDLSLSVYVNHIDSYLQINRRHNLHKQTIVTIEISWDINKLTSPNILDISTINRRHEHNSHPRGAAPGKAADSGLELQALEVDRPSARITWAFFFGTFRENPTKHSKTLCMTYFDIFSYLFPVVYYIYIYIYIHMYIYIICIYNPQTDVDLIVSNL